MEQEKKEVYLVEQGMFWAQIQAAAQHGVVQILAQVAQFDWLQPYRVHTQYENRGSGFLINNKGYIITNAHVVDQAQRVWIHMPLFGRQLLDVTVVGFCPDRDIALLKLHDGVLQQINAVLGGVPYLAFGDSDTVLRTAGVLTLGYPLGQHQLKSTTGIVSGRESIRGQSLIQITAPINPGSSGGPLFDAQGKVVGITVAVDIDASNVGYAIPIGELHVILDDLYTKKFVKKPFLGARFAYASDEKARFFNNPLPAGMYISTVFNGSLLEQAGVQAGDMLYEFNGDRIDAYGEARVSWSEDNVSLFDLIGRVKVGQKVRIVVYRKGQKKEFIVTFATQELFAIQPRYPLFETVEYEVIGGLVVMELTANHLLYLMKSNPDLAEYNRPENKLQPVLVITHVLPGSYAYEVRLLGPGFIITEINGKKVQTLADFRQAVLSGADTDLLTIKTARDTLVVLALRTILADEQRLSRDFAYPISSLVTQLQQLIGK